MSEGVHVSDERARAALTEQFGRREPTASKLEYSEEEWVTTFERPWIIPNKDYLSRSTEIKGSGGHAYCRCCVTEKKHGRLAAYRLHVAFEDDVMQVQKHGLIHVTCHDCNFDMLVPRKPRIRGQKADFELYDEFAKLDPNRMQELLERAQREMTATQVMRQQEDALRRMAAQMPQVSGQFDDLEKLKRAIEEQRRRNLEMSVSPPIIKKGGPFDLHPFKKGGPV